MVWHQKWQEWYIPQNMMTEWFWSDSLYAFARVCNLRNKEDAQSGN